MINKKRMDLENTVNEDQMSTFLYNLLSNPPLSWTVVLASLFTGSVVTLLVFGSFTILFTSTTVLILSTVLFIFSTRKQIKLVQKLSVKEEMEIQDLLASNSKQQHENEINTQQEEQASAFQIHDYLVRSPDVLSENECVDQLSTTEDSEVDWPFRDDVDHGWISDEDSLIEIPLSGGHYITHKPDEPSKYSVQHHHKLTDLIPESIFQQRNLMELLAEFSDMNEEDNLIEIDISMGSIKCSRFEIEA